MGMLYNLQKKLFTVVGDLAWYGWAHPMWVMYSPPSYKVKGDDLYHLTMMVAKEKLEPGDILLRAYDRYFSSFFIPGEFKHAGIYVGNVAWNWGELNPKWEDATPKHTVVHSISEGVLPENVINFFRTDHLVIVRPNIPKELRLEAAKKAMGFVGTPYDFNFKKGDNEIYCTELAALSYKGLMDFEMKTRGFGPFKRESIIADDIARSDVTWIAWSKTVLDFSIYKEIMEPKASFRAVIPKLWK